MSNEIVETFKEGEINWSNWMENEGKVPFPHGRLNKLVEVKYRSGAQHIDKLCNIQNGWMWAYSDETSFDILAYRVEERKIENTGLLNKENDAHDLRIYDDVLFRNGDRIELGCVVGWVRGREDNSVSKYIIEVNVNGYIRLQVPKEQVELYGTRWQDEED